MGMWSDVTCDYLPVTLPPFKVFMVLTDGHGRIPFSLKLVDVDDSYEPLFQANGEIEFTDPRLVAQIIVDVQPIEIRTAGEYRLQFHACGELIVERRLTVIAEVS
jgi:hypothetical protein